MLPTPIKTAAIDFSQSHVAVFPCLGDDGKLPLVTWGHLKRPPKPETIDKWWAKWPDANVGIATEPSRLTVVDCDDASVVKTMLRECGDTPLIAETPRGGSHLYYRHNGEMSLNRFRPAVDVKASGGFIVAPPSIRPQTGKAYTYVRGGLECLDRLPFAKRGSLPVKAGSAGSNAPIPEGMRNDSLFSLALRDARHCDDLDALLDCVRTNNMQCTPSLADAEVVKIASSAWHYQSEGRNWVGRESRVAFSKADFDQCVENPDALFLELRLRLAHEGQHETFSISPKAMERHQVIPGWSDKRYRAKRDYLTKIGRLEQIHKGGSRKGDPSLFKFPRVRGVGV